MLEYGRAGELRIVVDVGGLVRLWDVEVDVLQIKLPESIIDVILKRLERKAGLEK